jgi:hypothetical protein
MLASLPPPALADALLPSSLQTFFLIVMIVVAGYLYLRSQRYFARQKDDAASAVRPAMPPPEKQYTAVPRDLTRWEVEMHDTARQLSGQLDSKLAALGHLVREADRAAARLEAALSATRPPTPATTTTDACATAGQPDEPPGNQARALHAAGATEEPAEPPTAGSPSATPRPPADRRYEEIYLLADYGFDPAEISRRVGTPVGEIQLILSLRAKGL